MAFVEGNKPTDGLNKISNLPLNRPSGNDPPLTHADVKSGSRVCHIRCWNYTLEMLMSIDLALTIVALLKETNRRTGSTYFRTFPLTDNLLHY